MFAATARQLAGMSALLLGWRPDAFWAATPDELATCLSALTPDPIVPQPDQLARLMEMHPDG